jgi:VWFA-related protein
MSNPRAFGQRWIPVSRRRSHALALALALAAANALPASGRQQLPSVQDRGTFRESIVVREATLWVRLLGPRGPVRGIERERFRVTLAGDQLEVILFEEQSTEPARRARRRGGADVDPASEPDRVAGRSLLAVIELAFTPRSFALEATRSLRRTLDELGPEDRMAVLVLGVRASLVQPFTTDRDLLAASLELVEASLAADRERTQRAYETLGDLRRRAGAEPDRELGLRGALALDSDIGRALSSLPDPSLRAEVTDFRFDDGGGPGIFDLNELAEASATAGAAAAANRAFSDAVRLLADVPGPRYALLLSRGMSSFTKVIEDGIVRGGPGIPRSGAGSALLGSYQSLAYVLEGHGFVVQAVDVTGVGGRSTGFSMVDVGPRPELSSEQIAAIPELALRGGLVGDGSDALFFVAQETGGELYDNYNRLDGALREAYENGSHHYRLVVRLPSDPDFFEKRRRRTLEVRVEGLGARVRVASSMAADWALPGNLRRSDPIDIVRAELLGERTASMLGPRDARLAALPLPVEGAPRLRRALVALDIDLAALAPPMPGGRTELIAHAIALPLDPGPGEAREFIDLAVGAASWPATTGGSARQLVFLADLFVPCEGALIRARIADADQERSWVFDSTLAPACDGVPAPWVAALLGESNLFVLEEDFELGDAARNPFHLPSRRVLPTLRAEARAGERLEVLVLAGAVRLDLERIAVGLRDVRSGEVLVRVLSAVTDAGGQGTALAHLDLDVPPGRYELLLDPAVDAAPAATVVTVLPPPAEDPP